MFSAFIILKFLNCLKYQLPRYVYIHTHYIYIYEFEHLKVGMGGVPLKQSQSWRLGRLEAGGPEARTQPEGGTGHTSNAEARWRIISCVIYNIYIYMCDI